MRNGAVGDSLNVTGAFVGGSGSRLGVDANLLTTRADVLITGAATGSTILDVNLVGGVGFNTAGTLVVDGGAGTVASAFTLNAISVANPFVHVDLRFDAPANNFLLVAHAHQPGARHRP